MRNVAMRVVAAGLALVGMVAVATADSKLPASIKDELSKATYVYISSTRKDGSLGKPAEIWFLYEGDAIYVGTRPTSWRVKRIKAGRPQAKIWVGKPNGPSMFDASKAALTNLSSFEAVGSIVDDPKMQEAMLEGYAKKYPAGWPRHEAGFRAGFKDGSRVLVKYVPK